eukprot:Clim_evm85s210 gene=Clim_evmTU85s210
MDRVALPPLKPRQSVGQDDTGVYRFGIMGGKAFSVSVKQCDGGKEMHRVCLVDRPSDGVGATFIRSVCLSRDKKDEKLRVEQASEEAYDLHSCFTGTDDKLALKQCSIEDVTFYFNISHPMFRVNIEAFYADSLGQVYFSSLAISEASHLCSQRLQLGIDLESPTPGRNQIVALQHGPHFVRWCAHPAGTDHQCHVVASHFGQYIIVRSTPERNMADSIEMLERTFELTAFDAITSVDLFCPILAYTAGNRLSVWDMRAETELFSVVPNRLPLQTVRLVCLDPDGKSPRCKAPTHLLVAGQDNGVYVYEISKGGSCQAMIPGTPRLGTGFLEMISMPLDVNNMKGSVTRAVVAASCEDGQICLLNHPVLNNPEDDPNAKAKSKELGRMDSRWISVYCLPYLTMGADDDDSVAYGIGGVTASKTYHAFPPQYLRQCMIENTLKADEKMARKRPPEDHTGIER